MNKNAIVPTVIKTILIVLIFSSSSCSKQGVNIKSPTSQNASEEFQFDYLESVKRQLKDSLQAKDFATIDFSQAFHSTDSILKINYLRLYFKTLNNDDFILLSTDNAGNIFKGKIVHVNRITNDADVNNIGLDVFSLNRREYKLLKNKVATSPKSPNSKSTDGTHATNSSAYMAQEPPAGEQTLNPVIVTSYYYNNIEPSFWYFYSIILSYNTGSGGGNTSSYGSSQAGGGGGSQPVYNDNVINISYENGDQNPIDAAKYIKCFSQISNSGAKFKITLYSDIPVNNDPSKLFSFLTGAVGHTFLQLTKSNGEQVVTQNFGFYPESGWKSIEANGPVTSKMVDNAYHEYNASLSINVDATHFQSALNQIQAYNKTSYDIDNFNCTDFAISVFNKAAPVSLYIPQYHIPGGMMGELSNTPQGLYNELAIRSRSTGYPGGQIYVPKVPGRTGGSHGACN